MDVGVLGTQDGWHLGDLRRAAGTDHRIVSLGFRDLAARLAANREIVTSSGVDLAALDCVLVRTMAAGSLEQVVFRMDLLGRLEASGTVVVNSARSVECAVDKFLASAKLRAADLLVPETIVCQTAESAMAAFTALGGDVVLKPLFGSEGRGMARLTDEAIAERTFTLLANLGSVLYLQKFVPHESCDIRALVIGQRVLGMRRRNPNDWRTNVRRGASTEATELDDHLCATAHAAAAAVGATVAGVDLLPGRDGELYVLEVNAVPGWRALAATLNVDVARLVLDHLRSMKRAKLSEHAKLGERGT